MPPYLVFVVLVGAICGAIFHLWRGKTNRDLIIYVLTGIVGFGAGQLAGLLLGFDFMLVGSVHLLEATAVCWVSLFLMQWLKPFPGQ